MTFLQAGYKEEAVEWRNWLLRAVGGEPGLLQPVYGICGESRLAEWEADWLSGFGGAKPVRFGNDAFRQLQLDIYGEVVDALHQARLHGMQLSGVGWRMQARMIEHLEHVWREPDNGIWEIRNAPRRFTYSQAMAWAAVDRTIAKAEQDGFDAPLDRWRELRAAIHAEVCQEGYDSNLNSFVQAFGSPRLDASALLLPQIGFLPPDDPRIIGTVSAIGDRLQKGGFIFRYDTYAARWSSGRRSSLHRLQLLVC